MNKHPNSPTGRLPWSAGLSLIELLIALALTAMIGTTLYALLGQLINTNHEISTKSALQREMRNALDEIRYQWIDQPYANQACTGCLQEWRAVSSATGSIETVRFLINSNGLVRTKTINTGTPITTIIAPSAITGSSFSISGNKLTVVLILKKNRTTIRQQISVRRTDWTAPTR